MKVFIMKTDSGIKALYPDDEDKIKHLEKNVVYECDVKIPRNYEFLKKFMALVKKAHENTTMDMPFNIYRKYLIMKAGFVKTYKTPKGVLFEPESISFGSMAEDEFSDVYSRVLDVIIKELGMDKEEIEKEISTFL